MKLTKRAGTLAAAAALASAALLLPQPAEAHGRGGFRGGPIFVGGAFYGPHFGFGWGPYWGWGPWAPYWGYGPYYRPAIDLNFAMMAGFGAVEMDVKPGQAEVWVDGKYVAEARDLDGTPSFLWLKEGAHRVQVYKGGYVTFDERIDVQPGVQKELKLRLEKGESEPPGTRPEKRK